MTDTNLDRAAKIAGYDDWSDVPPFKASFFSKSIQAHAATLDELDAAKAELEAFKQKVSEAIQNYKADCDYKAYMALDRFIIPARNPLVDVLINQVGERLKINPHGTTWRDALREEIRGYEVRKIGEAGE